MSEVKVNKVTPRSGTTVQVGEAGDTVNLSTATVSLPNSTVTSNQLVGSIANAKLANSAITINGSAVSLGGSVTVGETKPTVSGITPATISPNSSTTLTIAGGNFASIPLVQAQNTSTGAVTVATAVAFSSASSITATFTVPLGTYKLYIENPDGNAVLTSQTFQASTGPSFTTNAGSLGSFGAGDSISGLNVVASSDSNVTITEVTSPLTLTGNSDTPASTMNLNFTGTPATTATYTIAGTAPTPTSATTYNFTLRATDVESQTTDRAFSITISVGLNNGGQFNP
tara:strand:- start:1086 stop:1943 length:858 start_codon:yes stop_codon:yes gene_type:complete